MFLSPFKKGKQNEKGVLKQVLNLLMHRAGYTGVISPDKHLSNTPDLFFPLSLSDRFFNQALQVMINISMILTCGDHTISLLDFSFIINPVIMIKYAARGFNSP